MKKQVLGLLAGIATVAVMTGCQCVKAKKHAAAPAPAPAKAMMVKKATGCASMKTDGSQNVVSQAFPTGDVNSSLILLETTAPAEVVVNQPFICKLKATNLTDCDLEDVVVTDKLPANLDVMASDPKAIVKEGNLAEWSLGQLGPKESKTITVKLQPKDASDITHCAKASAVTSMCSTVKVVSPKLQLKKTTPSTALLCNKIPVKLVVSNTGTGAIKNVLVTDNLPAGLALADGKTATSFTVPVLAAGESKEFVFDAKAAKSGEFKNTATATADGDLKAEDASTVVVQQPILVITKDATKTQFAGRVIDYTITVTNTGDAAAQNLVVSDPIPAGTTFVKASAGGKVVEGKVMWSVASLEPNGKTTVSFTVNTAVAGKIVNKATAEAACATAVSASAETDVKGIPAILLEVVDITDPIEVGAQETYVIKVTNQGNAPDNNIKIVCTLEDSQNYVSSSGPTAGTANGQVITFAPLASLGPKQVAEWKVEVKAVKAGDVRFTTQLTSDMLTRPVQETEATNQY